MLCSRFWLAAVLPLFLVTGAGSFSAVRTWADPFQRGRGDDAKLFDPEKFLEQFLGPDLPEQKEKLDNIAVPWEDERRFGQQACAAFLAELRRKQIRVVSRGPEVAYLRSLVAELQPLMQNSHRYRTITVLVAETPDADARCFPGGTLIILRGMLAAAQSEATLVAVLGHELSHIDHGHQLRSEVHEAGSADIHHRATGF